MMNNTSLSILYKRGLNIGIQRVCTRQFPHVRRYVNWQSDKPNNNSNNKKAKSNNNQPQQGPLKTPPKPLPPNGDPLSPSELSKQFQAPPRPGSRPTPTPPEEPQLVKLRNDKP